MNPNQWLDQAIRRLVLPALDRLPARWKTLIGGLLVLGLWAANEWQVMPPGIYEWAQPFAVGLFGVGFVHRVAVASADRVKEDPPPNFGV